MSTPSRPLIHLLAAASLFSVAAAQPAGGDAERAYRAGTGLLNRGMNDLAADEYRAFLRDHPDSPKAPQARYGLAVCLVRLGKHAEAAAELDKVVTLKNFEFAADAKMLRAQCCLAAGDAASAVDWLRRLLKDSPNFAGADAATALLGEAEYTTGDFTKARATLADIIEKWPTSPSRERAEYLLALCEAANGKDQVAADRLAKWRESHAASPLLKHATLVEAQCRHRAGDPETALSLYAVAAACGDPAIEPDALVGKAQLIRAAGHADQALATLDDLAVRYPKFAAGAAGQLERARCLAESGKFTQALTTLDAIPSEQAEPLGAEVAFWRARCELRLHHAEKAAAVLKRAVETYPKSPWVPDLLLERGAALTAAGNDADAEPVYQSIADSGAAAPLKARALLARAGTQHRLGKFPQSLAACREYLDDNPAGAEAADARLLIAENEYLQHAYDKAETAYASFLSHDPTHPQAWRAGVRRGLCLVQLNRPADAAPLLQKAAESADTGDPSLLRAAVTALGDIAFAASDWTAAERWLRQATDGAAPDSQAALLKLGLCLHRQSKLAEAVAIYERVTAGNSRSDAAIQASFERGQALVELKRFDDAKAAFEQTLAMEAKSESPRFKTHSLRHLAAIASAQGRDADAAALLDQLASAPGAGEAGVDAALDRAGLLLRQGDYEQAEAAYAAIVKAHPTHARAGEARVQHAIALCRSGKLEEAIKEFDSLSPSSAVGDPTLAAAAAYERAWALAHLNRTPEAIDAYAALLNSSPPKNIEAHAAVELAQLHISKSDFAAALPLLERCRAAASSPNDADANPLLPRAVYLRAVCELRTGQPGDAAKTLANFAKEFPRSDLLDSAGVTYGEALLATGRAAQAAREFSAVADRTTDQPLRSAALLRLGEAAAATQDWAASERAFSRHRELFADSDQWFRAAFGIGWALENAGKREDAIAAYRAVVEKHDGPTAARAQFQIGECLYGLGRLDEAVRELLKVDILYQYPQWSAAALYEAGRCFAEQKKHTEAIAQFEQVAKRFPDSQWAKPATEAAAAARPAPLPGRTSSVDQPASLPVTPGRLK